jgi:tripartite-type tricarboxylate transporter receptor subunit TctC
MSARLRQGLCALLLACAAPLALAQADWPTKPIRIFVGSPAGGLPDLVARVVGKPMAEALGQPLIIEARPGAGGNIAAEAAAKSAPDGYSFMLTTVGSHGIAPSLFKNMSFDPLKDFSGVARVVEFPTVLFVSNRVPAKNLHELVAYAKANPGKLNYGSTGPGTLSHLAGVLLSSTAGIDIVHIPQKSYAAAALGLMTGDLHLTFLHVTGAKDALPVAVAGSERFPGMPEVPTFEELGMKNLRITQWFGYVAPARTPRAVIERFAAEVAKSLRTPEVIAQLRQMTAVPAMLPPREFEEFYVGEMSRWAPVVKASGASVN